MKRLLATTAAIEVAAGVGLLAAPHAFAELLLGAPLEGSAASIVARVGGAALFALSVACWLARGDLGSRPARGVVAAMLIYNVGVAAVLAYAGIVLRMHAVALWPAVVLHAAMTGWCVACLRRRPHELSSTSVPGGQR